MPFTSLRKPSFCSLLFIKIFKRSPSLISIFCTSLSRKRAITQKWQKQSPRILQHTIEIKSLITLHSLLIRIDGFHGRQKMDLTVLFRRRLSLFQQSMIVPIELMMSILFLGFYL